MSHYETCSICRIAHYTNCETCLGFGVYDAEGESSTPVTAREAHEGTAPGNARACPMCGSTTEGAPKAAS